MMRAILLFALAISSFATTRNVTCSGTITTALQSAITASVDGDIVNIGSGSCTAGDVSFADKNIIIRGQGVGVTTVTGLEIDADTITKASWRITGMTVPEPVGYWNISAGARTTGIKGWRIDHVSFTFASCGQNISIWIHGITWGLIDHATFNNAGNAIYITSLADGSNETVPDPGNGTPGLGGNSWLLPLNLGTDEAVYVEDSSFTLAASCYDAVDDMYYGGRMVFRHNTVVNAYWQNHAARGADRGGNLKAEIYNNDFNATDSGWFRHIDIRSGTGVVFNNSGRGYFNTLNVDNQRSDGADTSAPFGPCDGSSAWDGNASGQSGWPCLDQIGRSSGTSYPNQTSVPLYAWNNGSALACSTGGTCNNDQTLVSDGDAHVLAGRDFINNGSTPKPGYTAYTYPHPLQGAAASYSGVSSSGNKASSGNRARGQ